MCKNPVLVSSLQEVDVVREQIQKFVSLPIWQHLHMARLEQELKAVPKLKKYWNIIQKKDKALDEAAVARWVGGWVGGGLRREGREGVGWGGGWVGRG